MTTAELIADVRDLTGSNSKDFTDAQIQNYIDQEYFLWQEKASKDDSIQWSAGDLPDVLDVTMTTNTEIITQNMNIIRVEADIDGNWVTLHKTDTESYGGPERKHGWCTCNFIGSCGYCRSFTEALEKVGTPHYYVQSNAAIQVFPFPAAPATQDIKIYYEGTHILNWIGGDTPRIPLFAHRILSLQAAALYRDIEDTGNLNFILSERTRLSTELERCFNGKTKIRQMHFTNKSYL